MRRTKEDSARTRQRILAAARKVFLSQGVARTTLEQIASAAKVTRGAIYWHFADKTELFYAMREQVSVPMLDRMDMGSLRGASADPLSGIASYLGSVVETMLRDPATRQTFEIMSFKCEYVGGLHPELRRHYARCAELTGALAKAYRRAQRAGYLRKRLRPELAALATCAFLIGLVRLWLYDRRGRAVRAAAARLISEHLAGCRRASR